MGLLVFKKLWNNDCTCGGQTFEDAVATLVLPCAQDIEQDVVDNSVEERLFSFSFTDSEDSGR